jgi:hypothetical protein
MSKESEDASGFFTKATEILTGAKSPAPAVIDSSLAHAKAQAVRAAARQLVDALEGGASLGLIDDKAKALGMEVLAVQQMTLQARKRSDK